MIPTYTLLSIFPDWSWFVSTSFWTNSSYPDIPVGESLSLFFILRAFSAGCFGTYRGETISDGVLAFKQPEWKNAV